LARRLLYLDVAVIAREDEAVVEDGSRNPLSPHGANLAVRSPHS